METFFRKAGETCELAPVTIALLVIGGGGINVYITHHLSAELLLPNQNVKNVNFTDNFFPCGSVVEHCVSSAKGRGFNSQGTRVLIKKK